MTKRYELRLDRSDLDAYANTDPDDDVSLVLAFLAFVADFAPDVHFTRVAVCPIRDARFGDDIAFTLDADDCCVAAYAAACAADVADVFDLA